MKTLKISLRNRYIPALLIIATLSMLGFVNMNDIMSSIENEGKIINISGRQRMLSQKLILLTDDYIKEASEETKNRLLENINLMEKSHEFLLENSLTSIVENVYKENKFDNQVKEYIQSFRNIIEEKNPKTLNSIKKESKELLVKLDEVVKIYENELDKKLKTLQERGLYLFLAILIVLLLEAIFIFRPASKKIYENTKFLKNAIKEKTKELRLMEDARMASITEMIGNIAHQWRQPLSSISTAASGIIVQRELGKLEDEFLLSMLNSINKNTQYLSGTIETFREIIVENDALEKFILQDKIDKVLNIINSSLEDKDIELIRNIDYENPIKIELLTNKLSQVLINIINNAKEVLLQRKIKKPWIKISLEKTENEILLVIEDNGGGIAKKDLPKIFDPYFTTKHKSQGIGLSLHFGYKIVTEILKGKLYVKNSKNGAKFFIEIPCKQ